MAVNVLTVCIFILANSTDITGITNSKIVLLQSNQEKNKTLQPFEDLLRITRSREELGEEQTRDKFMGDKEYPFYQKVSRLRPLVLLIEKSIKMNRMD